MSIRERSPSSTLQRLVLEEDPGRLAGRVDETHRLEQDVLRVCFGTPWRSVGSDSVGEARLERRLALAAGTSATTSLGVAELA